ncbi:uncharacterized protein LOC114463966 isoform X3 [Gouania willdenowi]|uniref:uncharacterized protein LOC114463966 isoform X3 n=1 Tax=Gouania willdenowi TaxID=441366 RepID=UPI0010566311|nr:uncharacterized protein LOC114463966 isoform X3 [Gouania willdenowi]
MQDRSSRELDQSNSATKFSLYAEAVLMDKHCSSLQDLAPAHTVKGIKSWFLDHGVTVFDWPANWPDLNSIKNQWRKVCSSCCWEQTDTQGRLMEELTEP